MRGREQVYPIFWVPCPGHADPRVMPVCALRTADDGGIRSRGRLRSSGVVGYAQAGAGVPVSCMAARRVPCRSSTPPSSAKDHLYIRAMYRTPI